MAPPQPAAAAARADRVSVCGTLWKEGRLLRRKRRRYFVLRGSKLSCARSKDAKPSWEIDVYKASVQSGERLGDLVLRTQAGRVLSLFSESKRQAEQWYQSLSLAAAGRRDFHAHYALQEVLGVGSFGEARKALCLTTGETVAVKVIDKSNCSEEDLLYLQREINIVKGLDHRHIVKTLEVFDAFKTVYICMEYMEGGMLYDVISEAGTFTEKIAAKVFSEIVQAIAYLHDNNIAHRDIKPENILCSSKTQPYNVKISDFGLSNFSALPMRTRVGTPYFVAPEVIRNEDYGPMVDSWSCGVVLYNLMSAKLPFDSENDPDDIFRSILRGEFSFPPSEWAQVSDDAKNLIRGLLRVDPQKRLTMRQALLHPWLKEHESNIDVDIAADRKMLHSSQRQLPQQ